MGAFVASFAWQPLSGGVMIGAKVGRMTSRFSESRAPKSGRRKVCAVDRIGSRFEVPRRLGVLAGAGKSLIDRSNACTFVIGSVQQRPTKIHLGNVGQSGSS
jgi:hypothetical protein